MANLERKLVAIMAADVVSYSKFMAKNEDETLHLIKSLQANILTPQIEKHKGKIFKKMGDGYLAEFPSVVDAIKAGISIQNNIRGLDPGQSDEKILKLRIGINLGDVIVDDGDIYGNGVNIAARLQSICSPNNIAITAKVNDEILGKTEELFLSTGFHKLKNIQEELEVFVWPNLKGYSIKSENTEEQVNANMVLSKKPSIAVLPFVNMSNDAEQEYFCDGITEDIITELSRFDNVFVISRNSTFTYKNLPIDMKTIARDLGVQYILEGSVRKSGQRVRITTQLIDGLEDTHLWAERYDGLLEDVFDLQEQVTQQVVMSLIPEIISKQTSKDSTGPRVFDESYDKAWRAAALLVVGVQNNEPNKIDTALGLCLESIEANPKCEAAYNNAGSCLFVKSLFNWGEDFQVAADQALSLSSQLLGYIQNSVTGYRMRGLANTRKGDFRAAISDLEKARELNPNDSETIFCLAYALACIASSEAAKKLASTAHRLSPKDPYLGRFFYLSMAMCAFIDNDNESFLNWAEKAIQAAPNAPIRRALMITYAIEENDYNLAKKHFIVLEKISPNFIRGVLNRENILFAEKKSSERLINGLQSFLTIHKDKIGNGAT